jgi:class 3 adenylate cyclase
MRCPHCLCRVRERFRLAVPGVWQSASVKGERKQVTVLFADLSARLEYLEGFGAEVIQKLTG